VKRTIAIILVVILSNILIYWITSYENTEEEVEAVKVQDLLEEKPAEEPRNLLLPAEAVEASRKPREVDPKKIFKDMADFWKEAARQSLPHLVIVEARRDVAGGETTLPAEEEASPLWHARKNVTRSGGIILDDGVSILTTYDLISGASDLRVYTLSGRVLQAKPIAADLVTRLAVVQVARKLPSDIPWGLAVEVGLADAVMTLYLDHQGEPRCVPAAITGLGYTSNPVFPGTVKSYLSLDLDDTQMMPGALVINAEGHVIGMINSMGRAIMTEQVVFVADSLIRHREVRRAWLGAQVQPLTDQLAPYFEQKASGGFLVTSVAPESPASGADLRPGDVITRIRGQVIRNEGLFRAAVSEVAPGSRMSMTVLREGEPMEIHIQLGLLVQEPTCTVRWELDQEPEVSGEAVETALLDALQVREEDSGVVIEGIDLERAMLSQEISREVTLLSVNRQPVLSLFDYSALKEAYATEESVLLEIKNGPDICYLVLEKNPD
jgi:serine protease Do